MEKEPQVLEVFEHPDNRVLSPLTDSQVRAVTAAPWIDSLEAEASKLPQEQCPVDHVFTPGLRPGEWNYSRTIFMRKGLLISSKIHRTEHQFFVTKGRCLVWNPDGDCQDIRAGHRGITKAGTRRVLLILEDTIWTTVHPTDTQDLVEIERQVILPHDFTHQSDQHLIAQASEQSVSFREALTELSKS